MRARKIRADIWNVRRENRDMRWENRRNQTERSRVHVCDLLCVCVAQSAWLPGCEVPSRRSWRRKPSYCLSGFSGRLVTSCALCGEIPSRP